MLDSVLLAIGITFMYSAPLIFGALAGVISEKSGVLNIGIEGMMVFGAFSGATVGALTGSAWIGFLAAGIGGSLMALLHAIASISFRANQTISGVALNFIGLGISLYLSRLIFDGATTTPPLQNKLPKLLSIFMGRVDNIRLQALNFDITVIIAFLCAAAMWFMLYKTKWGLRLMAVGEHPAAADTLGVNVYAVRYAAVIASGMLAGFGGAAQSMAVVSRFSPTVISGHGFIALAAVIFGKWTPHGATAACLVFGFAQALVVLLGGGTLPISSYLLSMLPYLLTLVVLVVFVGKSSAPKASGTPYQNGSR